MRTLDIANRLKGAKQLPALSVTSQKMLKMLNAPNTSVHELSAALAQDPPLSACVLKLANSVAYGGVETTKLPQAIMRIGLNMLRTLILSNSVLQRVEAMGGASKFDHKGFWRYCLACGIGARAVAYRARAEVADDAFLAGLLHGIGVTVLDVFFPEELGRIIERMHRKNEPLTAVILAETGLTLGQVGGVLISQWQLGERVGKAVALLDAPEVKEDGDDPLMPKLVDYLHIGTALARGAGLGQPMDLPPKTDSGATTTGWELINQRVQQALANCKISQELLVKRVDELKSDFQLFESLA